VIATGLIGQHRALGGVTWDYLNVLLGLKSLGHDVYYFEDSGEWPYTFDGGPRGDEWIARDPGPTVRYLAAVMAECSLGDKWAYRFPPEATWFGLADGHRRDIVETADVLINVSGTIERPEAYRGVRRLVYIDTDPVFTQIQIATGNVDLERRVSFHDAHFTVGECLGPPVPPTPYDWRPTKHPIATREWWTDARPRDAFTTVMNWTSYGPVKFQGISYGQKDVEFRRFLDLPVRVDAPFEVALSRTHHVRWESEVEGVSLDVKAYLSRHPYCSPQDLLRSKGWHVVDAVDACGDFRTYRDYLQSSRAEWSVAKNGYVRGRSGWFSGRSACYLAAGRPVVVQDTNFASVLPEGHGVLTFREPQEAVEACQEVLADYSHHSRAARAIAEEYFEAGKVLTRILEQVSARRAVV
jgi:hypothetical protein